MVDTLDAVRKTGQQGLADGSAMLATIRRHYAVAGPEDDIAGALGACPELSNLLLEAVDPIRKAFGGDHQLELRAEWTDEDLVLRAAIHVPPAFESATAALAEFDSAWWISNCQRSGAGLVFDYEVRDVRLA
jgi:hypothetical protein